MAARVPRVVGRRYRLLNTTKQTELASHLTTAATPWVRMKGLLGRSSLPEGEGLFFPGCRSIHTYGMQFPIDVIFVDRELAVVLVRPCLTSGRLAMAWCAWGVVELPSGTIGRSQTTVADRLQLECTEG